MRIALSAFALPFLALIAGPAAAQTASASLRAAVDSPARPGTDRARDRYRHPVETLTFFGLKPTDTVVELWPGGGWYTTVLAPFLRDRGRLIVAPPAGRATASFTTKVARDPLYARVAVASFPASLTGTPAAAAVAPGTADAVVTFRNVHNWRMGAGRPDSADYSADAFREIFAMLKPGGVLGIEDHRLPEDADAARERTSGYVKLSTVRRLAEAAGFRFAGSSAVNANPRDTHDHPKGVWTLPPTLAEGDKDRARYMAIGESDRMTLRFVKPADASAKGQSSNR